MKDDKRGLSKSHIARASRRIPKFHSIIHRFNGFLVVGILFSPTIYFFIYMIVQSFHDESGWFLIGAILTCALPALISLICFSVGIIKFLEYDEQGLPEVSNAFATKESHPLLGLLIATCIVLVLSVFLAVMLSPSRP